MSGTEEPAPREQPWDAALGRSDAPIVLPKAEIGDSLPRRQSNPRNKGRIVGRLLLVAALAGALTVAGYVAFSDNSTKVSGSTAITGLPTPAPSSPTPTPSPTPILTPLQQKQAALAATLSKALAVTAWPELTPSLADLAKSGAPQSTACLRVNVKNVSKCVFGAKKAKHHAVLIGDSSAMSYLPAILAALAPHGWSVQVLTLGSCPVAKVAVKIKKKLFAACATHHTFIDTEVKRLKPSLILLSDSPNNVARTANPKTGQAALASGLTAEIKTLRATTKHVVYLSPPPGSKNLKTCDIKGSTPADCVRATSLLWRDYTKAMKVAVRGGGASYLDLSSDLCVKGSCPAFAGTVPLYVDGTDLTAAYSVQLAFEFAVYAS